MVTLVAISSNDLTTERADAQSKGKGSPKSTSRPTLQDKAHSIFALGQQIFSPKGARFIDIPKSDSAYDSLKSQIYYSQQEIDDFLELAETKYKWEDFKAFKKSLAVEIDFKRESLLLVVIPAAKSDIVKLGLTGLSNETLFIQVNATAMKKDDEVRSRARLLAIDSRKVKKVTVNYQFKDVDKFKHTRMRTMLLRK